MDDLQEFNIADKISTKFNEKLPSYIYGLGVTGMTLMGISVIIFITFISIFSERVDRNINPGQKHSVAYNGLLYSFIAIGALGYLFCLAIPYGHYLKRHHDIGNKLQRETDYHAAEPPEIIKKAVPQKVFQVTKPLVSNNKKSESYL